MPTRRPRLAAAALTAAAACFLVGADEPTQPIRAGELAMKVPASWKKGRPTSSMRAAQLKIDPARGDDDPAELVITVFARGAGTVEANVARWESQFAGADGKAPKAEVVKKKGTNVDVTRVEVAGRYVAAVMPGSTEKNDRPNARLLGAIVQTDAAGYFFKLVGPDATVKSAAAGFDAMIASITKEGGASAPAAAHPPLGTKGVSLPATAHALAGLVVATGPAEKPVKPLEAVADEPGFRYLYRKGDPLAQGWKQVGPGSVTEESGSEGTLVTAGGMGMLWYAESPFADYTLRVDYKLSKPDNNSGVFVRFPDPPADPWDAVKAGYEIQICDGADPEHRTGAIYSFKAAEKAPPAKPVGEWNTYEIRVKGQEYTIRLNGEEINHYTGSRGKEGFVGLQNHDQSSIVRFRNVRIKTS